MSEELRIMAAVLFELMLLYIIGMLLPIKGKRERSSAAGVMCGGFLTKTAALEVTGLICTLLEMPLTSFCVVWSCVLGVLASSAIVLQGRKRLVSHFSGRHRSGGTGLFLIMLLAGAGVTVLSVWMSALAEPTTVLAQMTTDLYHNSLGGFEGATGRLSASHVLSDLLCRYYLGGEYTALLFGLHPLTVMKVVQQTVTMLLFLAAGGAVLRDFFEDDRRKEAAGMLLLMSILLFSGTPHSPFAVILTEGWTGNALLAGVLLPSCTLLLLSLYRNENRRATLILLFFAGICAVSFSRTATVLVPIVLAAGVLPIAFARKKPDLLLNYLLWVSAPVSAAAFYLYETGFSTLRAAEGAVGAAGLDAAEAELLQWQSPGVLLVAGIGLILVLVFGGQEGRVILFWPTMLIAGIFLIPVMRADLSGAIQSLSGDSSYLLWGIPLGLIASGGILFLTKHVRLTVLRILLLAGCVTALFMTSAASLRRYQRLQPPETLLMTDPEMVTLVDYVMEDSAADEPLIASDEESYRDEMRSYCAAVSVSELFERQTPVREEIEAEAPDYLILSKTGEAAEQLEELGLRTIAYTPFHLICVSRS